MVIHIRSTGFVYEERAMSQAEIATATFESYRARLLRIATACSARAAKRRLSCRMPGCAG